MPIGAIVKTGITISQIEPSAGTAVGGTRGIDGGQHFDAAWPRKLARVFKTQDGELNDEQGGEMATLRPSPRSEPISGASAKRIDMKFEVAVIPVADVDRAKQFYSKLGWRFDADFPYDNGFRVVQFTPPGSGCSVQFGTKITPSAPGSAQGLYLIVSDIGTARKDIVARGIEVSELFHPGTPGAQFQIEGGGRISGPANEHATYGSFATFRDPDGNGWLLQEVTTRLPGRGFGNLDVAMLTELLQEAEKHHGEYESTASKHNWPGWYAAYIVARQDGKTPEEAAKDGKIHIEVAS
jgi:predicted enzyme related to lactoylglutathione lyase